MKAGRHQMYNNNAFKLGLFGANCSSGRAINTLPERWTADWESCETMARLADEIGFDFILPIGRWKGYGGPTNFQGSTFETLTWATGLLAHTKRITVFGTVHAPLFNPMVAAKQMVTADQVGRGRFALNIVVGWNEPEFQMSGIRQREHGDKYDYCEEWINVIKRMWSEDEAFDFHGTYLDMHQVVSEPKPFGRTAPLIMNAGQSPVGKSFALRNCDGFFTSFREHDVQKSAEFVSSYKAEARAIGREIDVYTQGHVVCRPTRKEAEEYFHYFTTEAVDFGAVEESMRLKGLTRANTPDYEERRRMTPLMNIGYPIVGSPDDVAEKLGRIHGAGITGIGFSLVNYVTELPFLGQELMPRLEKMGMRAPIM
jgi:alkanesulfonate monooxygenase SsuD/methylene tetrahydromethanopterin reductase-like flavin-dependent oxidoreductase (luciferase family)